MMRWSKLFFSTQLIPTDGMTLFPIILIKSSHQKIRKSLVQHELIHWYQQRELLVLPFYVFYVVDYCIGLLIYRNHQKAYRNICFEREAYQNQSEANFLMKRPRFNFLNYIFTSKVA